MLKDNGLTRWGRVTHIYISNLTTICSDNGLSPSRRQAIIWNNAGILLIWPIGTNVNEILIDIHPFSIKKIHLKIWSGKWGPSCLGLNVLSRPIANHNKPQTMSIIRGHFVNAPSQCQSTLHCNIASHWLGAYPKWSLTILEMWVDVHCERNYACWVVTVVYFLFFRGDGFGAEGINNES